MRTILVFAVFAAIAINSSESLACYEGFNVSVSGVPFYRWVERNCTANSRCFSQELETRIFNPELKVLDRYSGCISSAYSSLLTCEKLFGPDSDLDPALLFNMIPDLENSFRDFLNDMNQNLTTQFQLLFSNGKGTESFIAGWFAFVENLGFNMEKVRPLESHFVKLFELLFRFQPTYGGLLSATGKQRGDREPHPEIVDMLRALSEIDTTNPEIAANLYTFFGNFLGDNEIHDFEDSIYSPLVENLPGLVKSLLPESWKVESWYDFVFEILGHLKYKSPKESTIGVINTMKKAVKIPKKYNKYFDPIFNTLPDLVEQLARGNSTYAGTWSLELLKAESTINSESERLSAAVESFYKGVIQSKPNDDILTLIRWIPGLFYNLFEGKEEIIDKTFAVISETIEGMNFQNLSSTLQPTKMSDFIIMMINITIGPRLEAEEMDIDYIDTWGPGSDIWEQFYGTYNFTYEPDLVEILILSMINDSVLYGEPREQIKKLNDFLVINLSRLLYNLLPDYKEQLDAIFTTLMEGFHSWPVINVGKIMKNLLIALEWEIPLQLQPLLDRLQAVINTTYNQQGRFQIQDLRREILNIVNEYDEVFPNSQLPHAVRGLVNVIFKAITQMPRYSSCFAFDESQDWTEYTRCWARYEESMMDFNYRLQQEASNVTVDLQFAIFNEINYDEDPFFQALIGAFPDYGLFIRLMKSLDPSDVKALMKSYIDWIFETVSSKPVSFSSNHDEKPQPTVKSASVDTFVKALDASIARITSKLGDITKELRSLFAPDSCKYHVCETDLCNKHQKIINKEAITRDPKARRFLQAAKDVPTKSTSSCDRMNASFTLILLLVFLDIYKLFRQ